MAVLPEGLAAWRPGQEALVEEIVDAYTRGCTLVLLDAPTGTGKTVIAEAVRVNLGGWRGVYLATTKTLQGAVLDRFPHAREIMGRGNYPTLNDPEARGDDCERGVRDVCRYCEPREGQCPYEVAKAAAKEADLAVLNHAYWLRVTNFAGWAMNKSRTEIIPAPFVVIDEADTFESHMLGFLECVLSPRFCRAMADGTGYRRPRIGDRVALVAWLEASTVWARQQRAEMEGVMKRRKLDRGERRWYRTLTTMLLTLPRAAREFEADDAVAIEHGEGLVLKPIFAAPYAPRVHWQWGTQWLAMSATILDPEEWVASAGWPGARGTWHYIQAPASIPAARRPIYYTRTARMTRGSGTLEWMKLVPAIQQIVTSRPDERIIVHTVSYQLTRDLSESVRLGERPVFAYAKAEERQVTLDKWLGSADGVLFAPSLDRGVSFDDDLCRVAIIAKIPYLNLGDPQIRARQEKDRRWYVTQTVRALVQMCGRVVRGPEDFGEVVILDATLDTLSGRDGGARIYPTWWVDGFKAGAGRTS